jgi:hypothetical protein
LLIKAAPIKSGYVYVEKSSQDEVQEEEEFVTFEKEAGRPKVDQSRHALEVLPLT